MEKGDVVIIYQDPITKQKVDGAARLLKRIPYFHTTLQQWEVVFLDDGIQTIRLIKA